jgi:hypothetical protein
MSTIVEEEPIKIDIVEEGDEDEVISVLKDLTKKETR